MQNGERTKKYATSRKQVLWLMFLPSFDVVSALSEYTRRRKWTLCFRLFFCFFFHISYTAGNYKRIFLIFEVIVCTEIHRGNLVILCYYEMGRGETVVILLLTSSQENSKLYKNKRYPGKHMLKIHRLPSSERFLAPFGCTTAHISYHSFFFSFLFFSNHTMFHVNPI